MGVREAKRTEWGNEGKESSPLGIQPLDRFCILVPPEMRIRN